MKLLLTLTAAVILLALGIRIFENKFIYFPSVYPAGFWVPQKAGVPAEDCWFAAEDGVQLHGWYVAKDTARATLLWCHGNAGNLSDRLDNLARLRQLPLNIFIFDYRGYGRSQGTPDEAGIYRDARAAYDYLVTRKHVQPERLIIFGRSLGGAVAVDLATQRACAGLILESTFTSAKDMAKRMFGFLPVYLLTKTRFDSIRKIRNVTVPKLFIHGTADQTVPHSLGVRLYEAAPGPKGFYEIPGADHNDTYLTGGKAYFQKLSAFILHAVGPGG